MFARDARRAIETAFRNDITIYDSSYVSLVMQKNAQFYTADDQLIGRLKKRYSRFVTNIRDI